MHDANAAGDGWVSVGTIEGWFDDGQEARDWLKRMHEQGLVRGDNNLASRQALPPSGTNLGLGA